ncbi:2-dehydro-3-deoxy-D-gluconate 5-dehydrogenase [subsurface metagenome]
MILDKFNLKDKVAIVTGASSGLGKGIALALSEAGASLVLVSRRLQLLQEVAKLINKKDQECFCFSADVSKKEQVKHTVEEAVKIFGKIDILVNTAGINRRNLVENFSEEDWNAVIDINLKGTFLFSQAVGKVMIKQNKGKIINTASMTSVIGGQNIPAYSASKGGVVQLTKAFAVAWAKYNINVNTIGPGWFKTPMTKSLYKDKDRNSQILSHIPMKRWGEPEDLAGAVVFLASEASNYVTGTTIYVDGGYLAY